jgi:hypothetical protein
MRGTAGIVVPADTVAYIAMFASELPFAAVCKANVAATLQITILCKPANAAFDSDAEIKVRYTGAFMADTLPAVMHAAACAWFLPPKRVKDHCAV